MVVRCPYCVRFDHFMTMHDRADGTYVCERCEHTAIPEDKLFRCSCSHCLALNAFKPGRERAWLASA
jgi:primosomal protein N'